MRSCFFKCQRTNKPITIVWSTENISTWTKLLHIENINIWCTCILSSMLHCFSRKRKLKRRLSLHYYIHVCVCVWKHPPHPPLDYFTFHVLNRLAAARRALQVHFRESFLLNTQTGKHADSWWSIAFQGCWGWGRFVVVVVVVVEIVSYILNVLNQRVLHSSIWPACVLCVLSCLIGIRMTSQTHYTISMAQIPMVYARKIFKRRNYIY